MRPSVRRRLLSSVVFEPPTLEKEKNIYIYKKNYPAYDLVDTGMSASCAVWRVRVFSSTHFLYVHFSFIFSTHVFFITANGNAARGHGHTRCRRLGPISDVPGLVETQRLHLGRIDDGRWRDRAIRADVEATKAAKSKVGKGDVKTFASIHNYIHELLCQHETECENKFSFSAPIANSRNGRCNNAFPQTFQKIHNSPNINYVG